MGRTWGALTVACLLLLVPASLAGSGHISETVIRDAQELPIPAPDPAACKDLSNCQDLQGTSIWDYHIAQEMQDAKDSMESQGISDYYFEVELWGASRLLPKSKEATSWIVCAFDGQDQRLDCRETYVARSSSYILTWAGMPEDTETLRVILKTNPVGATYNPVHVLIHECDGLGGISC